jgi:uncharacterized protein YggE
LPDDVPVSDDVVISVRGDASVVVDPDLAVLDCTLRTNASDKASALASAASHLRSVEAALAGLGGTAATSAAQRIALSWTASSAGTRDELYYDRHTEQHRPSGQVIATVSVQVRVRALELLPAINSALAHHQRLHVEHVSWHVDDDNPAWPRVRADAIRAALQRARDYAAALGGSVAGVQQIADTGLLGADHQLRNVSFEAAAAGSGHDDAPRLDPVPQQLSAVIEARVIASVPELSL